MQQTVSKKEEGVNEHWVAKSEWEFHDIEARIVQEEDKLSLSVEGSEVKIDGEEEEGMNFLFHS